MDDAEQAAELTADDWERGDFAFQQPLVRSPPGKIVTQPTTVLSLVHPDHSGSRNRRGAWSDLKTHRMLCSRCSDRPHDRCRIDIDACHRATRAVSLSTANSTGSMLPSTNPATANASIAYRPTGRRPHAPRHHTAGRGPPCWPRDRTVQCRTLPMPRDMLNVTPSARQSSPPNIALGSIQKQQSIGPNSSHTL